MTEVIDGLLVIAKEAPRICEYCGELDGCRPYGEGGKDICGDCILKPENGTAFANMKDHFANFDPSRRMGADIVTLLTENDDDV